MRSRGFAMWVLGLVLLLATAACTASRPPTPTPPPASDGGAAEATQRHTRTATSPPTATQEQVDVEGTATPATIEITTLTPAEEDSPTPESTPADKTATEQADEATAEPTPDAQAETDLEEKPLARELLRLAEQYRKGELDLEGLRDALAEILTGHEVTFMASRRIILREWWEEGRIPEEYAPFVECDLAENTYQCWQTKYPLEKIYNDSSLKRLLTEYDENFAIYIANTIEWYLNRNWGDEAGFWQGLRGFCQKANMRCTLTAYNGSVTLLPDGSYIFGPGYNNEFLKGMMQQGQMAWQDVQAGKIMISEWFGYSKVGIKEVDGWGVSVAYPQQIYLVLQPSTQQNAGAIVVELAPTVDQFIEFIDDTITYKVDNTFIVGPDKVDAYLP